MRVVTTRKAVKRGSCRKGRPKSCGTWPIPPKVGDDEALGLLVAEDALVEEGLAREGIHLEVQKGHLEGAFEERLRLLRVRGDLLVEGNARELGLAIRTHVGHGVREGLDPRRRVLHVLVVGRHHVLHRPQLPQLRQQIVVQRHWTVDPQAAAGQLHNGAAAAHVDGVPHEGPLGQPNPVARPIV
eukprot:scaffold564_cov248-Pinguiococcus_pyrenoidosus.AAC.23